MTLEDIATIPKSFLTPHEVAQCLGSDPQTIRLQARKDASKLGFPVVIMGSRVKIPKEAFIKFMCGEVQAPCSTS